MSIPYTVPQPDWANAPVVETTYQNDSAAVRYSKGQKLQFEPVLDVVMAGRISFQWDNQVVLLRADSVLPAALVPELNFV